MVCKHACKPIRLMSPRCRWGGGGGEGEETSFFVTALTRYLTRGGGGVCQCLRVTRHIHVLAWFLDFNSGKCKIEILYEGFLTVFVLQHLLSFCVLFLAAFLLVSLWCFLYKRLNSPKFSCYFPY
jgi:hypothetical protein